MTTYVITFQEMGIEHVLGVADSIDRANEMIDEYFGEYETIKDNDVRDSGIEFIKTIRCKGENYTNAITVQSFTLNSID